MKRLGLIVGIALLTTVSFAQKGNITNAALAYKHMHESMQDKDMEGVISDGLEAKKYIDLACAHSDTKESAKALMYKGKIYMELAGIVMTTEDKTQFEGLDPAEMGTEAIAALKKSKEVDKKGRYVDDVNNYVGNYHAISANAGIDAYGKDEYETAMAGLLGAAEFGEIIGVKDSMYYFFGGMAAYKLEKWDIGESAFAECVSINYKTSESVGLLAECLNKQDKKDEAENVLKTAIEKNPEDLDVLIQMINFYIDTDRKPEAEKALKAAIALDPENTSLLYTSGNIYENMGKIDDAEAAYRKTLEIDPDNVNAKFSLGGLFFNKGADLNNQANKLEFGDPAYDQLITDSKDSFKKALPFLEEAAAAEPKDVVILESLKSVYGKLGMTDKYKETKEKIQALK